MERRATTSEPKQDIFVVDIHGKERRFKVADATDSVPDNTERCRQVLLDFREVGVKVIDDYTLELAADGSDAVFSRFACVLPARASQSSVPREIRFAELDAAREYRDQRAIPHDRARIRDRVRLERSDTYWDRENVKLNIVDALSVDDRTTAFNLYMTGMVDWETVPPAEVLRELLKAQPPRNDLNPAPQLYDLLFSSQHDATTS